MSVSVSASNFSNLALRSAACTSNLLEPFISLQSDGMGDVLECLFNIKQEMKTGDKADMWCHFGKAFQT